jgi:tetrapyrrole methylase family protein/MazG family protein
MTITVVGLGPGDPGLMTLAARDALGSGRPVYFRTRRHPGVEALILDGPWQSFDALYDGAETFEAVYDDIVVRLSEAGADEEIVYAVPGDPLFGEATVQRLLERERAGTGPPLRIVHGVSFLEPVCAALGLDPLAGLQIVDALEPRVDPVRPAIIAQVYARHAAGILKLALLELYPAAHPVTVVRGAGLPGAHVEALPREAIARRDGLFDHLACLYVPALASEANLRTFDGLRAISHRLRSPEGCPWDREQTHASLKRFLLEEAYEALDALDANDPAALREELGDLLLQMTLHTEIAEEHGEFTYGEVFQSINEKLIRRHPHVFADADVQTADEQWKLWQQIKRAEKPADESILAGVSKAMPALAYAQAVQERAARAGFDWPALDQVLDKLSEELDELRAAAGADEREDEFGDVLFVLANVARWLDLDAEAALRRANAKFYRRFAGLEALAHQRGRSLEGMTLDEMEALYQEVKARE